ncbi:uncharacterized protein VNE69_04026 [Vairimorpha necatrix]|uniref:Zinc-ribbon 15 domain-containing protein n=1 Tax=Vairimorpha necatrix TaxID=6039 RepID=A0AAX4JBD7_9MICR
MVCCILCGARSESKRIGKPEGFPDAPEKILCPRCGTIAEGEYRKAYDRFCVCIIPCCCKCNKTEPFVACSNCHEPIGVITGNKCRQCSVATSFRSQNCPNCGARK